MSIENQDLINGIKKHPIGVACGLLVLVFGAATYLRSSGLPQLEATLAERTATGERQQANIRNAAGLRDDLATISAATRGIDERAIDPRALAINLQYFYELEAQLGVRLIELRQGAAGSPAKGASYLAVPYSVAIMGTYDQALRFLQHLENGPRFVRIKALNLEPSSRAAVEAAGSAGDPAAGPLLTLTLSLDLLGKS